MSSVLGRKRLRGHGKPIARRRMSPLARLRNLHRWHMGVAQKLGDRVYQAAILVHLIELQPYGLRELSLLKLQAPRGGCANSCRANVLLRPVLRCGHPGYNAGGVLSAPTNTMFDTWVLLKKGEPHCHNGWFPAGFPPKKKRGSTILRNPMRSNRSRAIAHVATMGCLMSS